MKNIVMIREHSMGLCVCVCVRACMVVCATSSKALTLCVFLSLCKSRDSSSSFCLLCVSLFLQSAVCLSMFVGEEDWLLDCCLLK